MPKSSMPKSKATAKVSSAEEAASLSYNEAHTALQVTLAALQASDLDVEAMATLYRQARSYLERCETVLAAVEQEVLQWDGTEPKPEPEPRSPDAPSETGANPSP